MFYNRKYLRINGLSTMFINLPIQIIFEEIGSLYAEEFNNDNRNGHNGRKKFIKIVHDKFQTSINSTQIKKLYRFSNSRLNRSNIYCKIPFNTDIILQALIELILDSPELLSRLIEICKTERVKNENHLFRQVLLSEYYNQLIAHKTAGCFEKDKKAQKFCIKLDSMTNKI